MVAPRLVPAPRPDTFGLGEVRRHGRGAMPAGRPDTGRLPHRGGGARRTGRSPLRIVSQPRSVTRGGRCRFRRHCCCSSRPGRSCWTRSPRTVGCRHVPHTLFQPRHQVGHRHLRHTIGCRHRNRIPWPTPELLGASQVGPGEGRRQTPSRVDGCKGRGARSAREGGTDTGAQRGYGHIRPALAGAGPGQGTLGAAQEVRDARQPGRGTGGGSSPLATPRPGAACPRPYAQPVPRHRTAGPPGLSTVVSDAISYRLVTSMTGVSAGSTVVRVTR